MADEEKPANGSPEGAEIQETPAAAEDVETPPPQEEVEEKPANGSPEEGAGIQETPAAAEDVETPPPQEEVGDNAETKKPRPVYEPTFLTDERGNLKAVNLVVRHPCKIFWLILSMCFGLSFLLQVLVWNKAENGNPFTAPENEFDLSDVRSIQYDSLRLAKDQISKTRSADLDNAEPADKQSEISDLAYWVFEAETPEGLFGSAEDIEAMKDAFDIFWQDEGFKDYCLLDYRSPNAMMGMLGQVMGNSTENSTLMENSAERQCTTPTSPLSMYYASEWNSTAASYIIEELKDPAKLDLFNTLGLCYTKGLFCELVPANISGADVLWAERLGLAIAGMTQKWDMNGDLVENFTQVTELASYLIQVDVFKGFVDFGFDKGFSTENPVSMYSRGIVWWGGPLEARNETLTADKKEDQDETEDDIRKDFIKENYLGEMDAQAEAGTNSSVDSYYFMITLIGDVILEIVTRDALLALFSLAFVFFWLGINTGSWFLATVGLFEIFFSIPVSWFIFTVVFQIKYFATLNSLAIFIVAAIGADDIFIFMDAYKQSKIRDPENLVDLETRMSWVYRRTGTAMAITSATTCAAFLCTLITPLTSIQSFGIFAAVVIFIDYVLVMTLFCTAVVIYHDRYEDRGCCGCCCPCGVQKPTPTDTARETLEGSEEEVQGDRISQFFRTKVAGFVQKPLNRLLVGLLFAGWLGVAIWQASMIEPTQENEQFLDEDHPLQKSITILNREFPTANEDAGLKIYYTWGVGEVDRTGVNLLLDPTNFGKPTFVDSFDFNAQCQTDLLTICDKMKTDPKYKELIKRKDGVGEVFCFIEELAVYNEMLQKNITLSGKFGGDPVCDYVRKGAWKSKPWQVDPAKLPDIMDGFLKQKSCYDNENTETISGRYSNEIGWDGSSLKYAGIAAASNVLTPFGFFAEATARKEYDQFIDLAKEVDQVVSQSCTAKSEGVIMTDLDGKFVFMNNQAIYVDTALQSSILGVAIAFVVLLVSTRVFHLAFFASLSIVSVLVSVVGMMVMLGWYLGSIEAILIGIIAGFSVDYVVHLAHAYEIAEGDTNERIVEAFGDLGISVFNGMITSVAASIPLFFCQLQFFAKFGTFLCLTIAFSWVFANFGFMSLLAQLKIPIKNDKCLSC